MILTLNFQGQIWDCHVSGINCLPQNETQIYQLTTMPQIWPWPWPWHFFSPLSPPGWRGIVVTIWVGGCQTCGNHISVKAWRIFSIQSSVEFSRPIVVHCHGQLPICHIWACPWAKNLSKLQQIGYCLCWMDLPHLKFHGLVWTCSCATS